MLQFRISRPARADFANILATSALRWGIAARDRYASLLMAAMRRLADDPQGQATRDRSALQPGLRSVHTRHVPTGNPDMKVANPVHVIYYRIVGSGRIEIVRVLHERMEADLHLRR